MADISASALAALAKQQLGLPSSTLDSRVPRFYTGELRRHLSLLPEEHDFRVTLQPKLGLGTATCLKDGCNAIIPLVRRVRAKDGGRIDGFGSLSAYRDHLLSHAPRKTRVKHEPSNPSLAPQISQKSQSVKIESSTDKPVPTKTFSMRTRSASNLKEDENRYPTRSSVVVVKPEVVEPAIPRKRLSDIAFGAETPATIDQAGGHAVQCNPPKKVKTETSSIKIPLSQVTNAPIASGSRLTQTDSIMVNSQDPQFLLENVRVAMAGQQRLLVQVLSKPLTAEQIIAEVQKHEAELTRLRALEQEYASRVLLASEPGPSRLPFQRPSVDVKPSISASAANVPTRSEPILRKTSAPNYPLPMDVDRKPIPPRRASNFPVKFEHDSENPFAPKTVDFTGKPSTSKSAFNLPNKLEPGSRNSVAPNAVASGSRSLVLKRDHPNIQIANAHNANTVASGSRSLALKSDPHVDIQMASGYTSNAVASGSRSLALKRDPHADIQITNAYNANAVASGSRSLALKNDPHADIQMASGYNSNTVSSGSRSLALKNDPDGDIQMANAYNSEDEDSEIDYNPLAQSIVEQLGMNIPPPIHDDAHDDNGDYHGRGRDFFVGPQAVADDLEKFLVEAGNAESFDGNESVEKALKYLELTNLQQRFPGMEISLMAHQVMGVAWMLEKERSSLKGGCLADEMGLGKTVQMMATLVKNRSTNPACKTNLIIAPLALLDQWKEEIETKTNCGMKCLIYHGRSKTGRRTELLKHDVVLTTFQTMASEWPDYENEMKKKAKAKKRGDDFIDDSDAEDMRDYGYRTNKRKQQAGLLFQTEFYRVIADEGQNIRNRRTRMSRAITDLNAMYRWCLTGTPIVNSLADVYGLIRFLKIRPWYDWNHFQSKIGILERKNPGLAVARLQKLMATFLLRRKKDSKLDGKNLIELPPRQVDLVRLEFSEEEREIYSMVEARSQAKFNRYLRAGTVLKNYHQVLVLLLRLRQICSHPSLIQEDGVTFVGPDEAHVKPQFSTELTRARRLISEEFVSKLKEKFLQAALARMEAEKKSENATIEEEECPICYDAMTDAVVTSCTHLFCRECIVDVIKRPLADGSTPCPVCRASIADNALFSRQAFEPSDKELDPSAGGDEEENSEDDEESDIEMFIPKGNAKGKGRAISRPRRSTTRRVIAESDDEGDSVLQSGSEDDNNSDDDDDMSDFIVESDEDEEEKDARRALKKRLGKKRANVILDSDEEPETPEEKEIIFGAKKRHEKLSKEAIKLMPRFLPSSKMKYMMDQLQKRAKSHPEEKTLIVSQWTGCLSLVSHYLTEKAIPHVKYQGDMSRTKRNQAVQIFMSREKARVMLMSLKCGGVGLNLTRANNVISLDLGWSQAVESQAFDRVHRVGQERDVFVQRVVIADTVEDRILQMQERKKTLADGSLGEGGGKKIGKLSVKELANLFGLDARGRRLDD